MYLSDRDLEFAVKTGQLIVIPPPTEYDTTSILKFITMRFGLTPLPGVRAGAGDLTNALDLR